MIPYRLAGAARWRFVGVMLLMLGVRCSCKGGGSGRGSEEGGTRRGTRGRRRVFGSAASVPQRRYRVLERAVHSVLKIQACTPGKRPRSVCGAREALTRVVRASRALRLWRPGCTTSTPRASPPRPLRRPQERAGREWLSHGDMHTLVGRLLPNCSEPYN